MILTRLRMKDFRQYRGEHDLRFAEDPDRNVTVVQGPNGAGKSSLFLALNWCLYGDQADIETKGQLINKNASDDDCFVEVHFRHEGRQYIAHRVVHRTGGREVIGPLQLDALAPGGKVTAIPSPSGTLNTILPSDARRYFFFDGERIDELSRPGHESEVNDAVRSVLNLKVLERAVKHLQAVEKDLAKQARKTDALGEREVQLIERTERLNEDIEALRAEKAAGVARMRELDGDIAAAREALERERDAREIALQQEALVRDLERLEVDRSEVTEAMASTLPRLALPLVSEAVAAANSILDEKRARGEIPSLLRQHLIDDLVIAGTCICDRPLDASAMDALNRRRGSAASDELEEVVQLATGRIKTLIADEPDAVAMARRHLGRRSDLIDRQETLHREIDELSGRLRRDFSDEVAALQERISKCEDEMRDRHYRDGRIDTEIEALQSERDAIGKELAGLEASDAEAKRLRRKYDLARDSADAVARLLEAFRAHARASIEEETDRVFKSLIWKRDHFDRVTISDDYALDVVDRYGSRALMEISAGERQVLSLAFIIAMAAFADHEAPLVIDTPFGRISKEVQSHLAERLPAAAPQLVLLLTDSELDDGAAKVLAPFVGQRVELDFDDSTGSTSLRAVEHV